MMLGPGGTWVAVELRRPDPDGEGAGTEYTVSLQRGDAMYFAQIETRFRKPLRSASVYVVNICLANLVSLCSSPLRSQRFRTANPACQSEIIIQHIVCINES